MSEYISSMRQAVILRENYPDAVRWIERASIVRRFVAGLMLGTGFVLAVALLAVAFIFAYRMIPG